jgi:hypothetical protein
MAVVMQQGHLNGCCLSSECIAENIGAGIMKRHDDPSVCVCVNTGTF